MANLKKILLVDDDDDLREALSEQLVMTEDFDVFEARTGAEGMEKAKAGHYDLVILDVGLPDTDGRELCRKLRKQGVKSPILMLTGHDTDADTILGLDAGANDYVAFSGIQLRVNPSLSSLADADSGYNCADIDCSAFGRGGVVGCVFGDYANHGASIQRGQLVGLPCVVCA